MQLVLEESPSPATPNCVPNKLVRFAPGGGERAFIALRGLGITGDDILLQVLVNLARLWQDEAAMCSAMFSM